MRRALYLVAVMGLLACASQPLPPNDPHPNGTSIETRVLAQFGPRIPNGTIYAAGDVTTLKALVDAGNSFASQQLGALPPGTHQCMAPYAYGAEGCWKGVVSSSGTAYVAFAIQGGFCQTTDPPQVFVSGFRLYLTITSHSVPNCRINGVVALPSAALIGISTDNLKPGLYAVDYVLKHDSDVYQSASAYLSLPSPTAADQSTMEAGAVDALTHTIGMQSNGLFSESRVDGTQLKALCDQAPSGPQFLVTFADSATRQMQVELATTPPHACTATSI